MNGHARSDNTECKAMVRNSLVTLTKCHWGRMAINLNAKIKQKSTQNGIQTHIVQVKPW